MDRVYNVLLSLGYPREGIDWLRRHRLATILVLAAIAWAPVIAVFWLLLQLIGGSDIGQG
jgi:hypothetical protein